MPRSVDEGGLLELAIGDTARHFLPLAHDSASAVLMARRVARGRTGAADGATPGYLHVEFTALRAKLVDLPARQQVPVQCDEQMVVEFYSR